MVHGHLYPGPHITAFIHRMANTGKGLQLLPGILNREDPAPTHTHRSKPGLVDIKPQRKIHLSLLRFVVRCIGAFEPIPISHKRRIKTEEEAKVVTAVWETLLNSSWGLKT